MTYRRTIYRSHSKIGMKIIWKNLWKVVSLSYVMFIHCVNPNHDESHIHSPD